MDLLIIAIDFSYNLLCFKLPGNESIWKNKQLMKMWSQPVKESSGLEGILVWKVKHLRQILDKRKNS